MVDEAPELQSVAIGAWVKTGSRHESNDDWGMSHFLEHMLFKGSERRGAMDISKAVDRVGGDFNAFTSRENTCFHFYLPASEVKLGALLLEEILSRPLFAAKELERERQVILQEIAMTRENPEEDAFDRFMEKFFGVHSLGRNILGSEGSIKKLSRAQLFQFFYRHYRPENMVLAVSGAIRADQARKVFSKLGRGAWNQRKSPAHLKAKWGIDPPEKFQEGFWWLSTNTEQAHVIYGLPAPTANSRERLMANLLQQYLGGGMSSVLFDQIREKKGWAYTVYANAIHFLDSSLFAVYAGVKKDRVLETLEVIHREIRKVGRHGIPATELNRLKDSMVYSIELSLESTESRMMTISQSELFSRKEFSFREYEALVRSVKSSEIQAWVKSWVESYRPSVMVASSPLRSAAGKGKLQRWSEAQTKKKIEFLK